MRQMIFLAGCWFFAAQQAVAQTPGEVKQLFPGQDLVFLKYDQHLKLYMKDGIPVAETRHENEVLVMSEKNASQYNRYKVYHSGYNELTDLNAYTLVPDGNRYRKLKVEDQKTTNSSSNSVFYDDVKETSFNFPGLVQNAIQHVEYSQFHKDVHLLSPYYLPESAPVISATFSVTVPNGISIRYVVRNDQNGLFRFTEEKKRKETVYTWTAANIGSKDGYGNAPNFRYFVPHVIIYVSSYENESGNQNLLNSLQDLYKWNIGFISELNKAPDHDLQKLVDSLVAGKNTQTDKSRSIYRWVQQHIKYVAFENGLEGFRPRQAAEVCRKRYGDCKDMSSIITQMLRIAGIPAYYTWIGTRDLPYDYSDLPLPIVDNHMISVAFIDGNWLFLDGTDSHARFGVPPAHIQDKEALVAISDKEYKLIRVPVTNADQNRIVDSTIIRVTNEGVKGTEQVSYYGYFGEDVYNTLLYRDEKETKDYVKTRMGKASNKFILGAYTIKRLNEAENIAHISAEFEIPGYGKKVGNEYYINLNLEKLFENRLIDTAARKVPMEEDYKFFIRQHHILEIPEGYSVSYLPANFSLDNDLVSLSINYEIKDRRVIATQVYQNKKLLIEPAEFSTWNKSAKAAALQYKEQIILEKK